MFANAAAGVTEAAREKRDSLAPRVEKMMAILAPHAHEQFLVWCDRNDEQRAIERALDQLGISYSSLDGAMAIEEREDRLEEWRAKKTMAIVTKPSMYGAGVNLQQCHRAVFVGIGFKFSEFRQALARVHRFMQTRPVEIHLIYTEAERSIRKILELKWRRNDEQANAMSRLIVQYGLADVGKAEALQRTTGVGRQEIVGEGYRLVNNDAVLEARDMEADSVDLIVTSIPFATQYAYSPNFSDFGHTDDNGHFWRQMDFLTPELLRVLKPGRVAAIHVKDRITPGGVNGYGFQTVEPFSDECAAHFRRHGFAFLARKTVVTDVVRENAQTYRLGWTEQCKDGSRMGAGMPEYVLLFRKPPTDRSNGYADTPVVKRKPQTEQPNGSVVSYDYDGGKIVPGSGYSRARWQLDAHGFSRSSGDRLLTPEELLRLQHADIYKAWRAESLTTVYDIERHVAIGEALEREKALPSGFMLLPPHSWHPDVWTDIARMRTLNMEQERRGQEMHLCPLQFDIVDRLIVQFSMKGETILDPFAGLMTVPYCAVKLGRSAIGVELNASYFRDGVRYVAAAAAQRTVPTLFSMEPAEAERLPSHAGSPTAGA